ncbi:hypothetical protein HDG34_003390 [Paraburkholderia sp. HC6.4b]|nr:hypothetical protein [Paraburkholderia sp. HC6.4b]MBB5451178.1 hypothetical protein [Paraburkholderia sp. Kb1A]
MGNDGWTPRATRLADARLMQRTRMRKSGGVH